VDSLSAARDAFQERLLAALYKARAPGELMGDSILYEKSGHVATITMNRPDALNAITVDMIESFAAALQRAQGDSNVRVLIIAGSGRAFCVGADIRQLQRWEQEPELRARFYDLAPKMFEALEAFPRPVIAAVNGVVAAGGFELCCFCDIVIAAEDARIGDAHANFVGFGPVSAVIAPRMLPPKLASELLFAGEMWSAVRMKEAGLVNHVVASGQALAAAHELAAKIASKQPLALEAAKSLMRRTARAGSAALMSDAFEHARRIFETEDFAEGLRAFHEKRPPVFTGR